MTEAEFQNKVDSAILFGDRILLKKILLEAKKHNFINAIDSLENALGKKKSISLSSQLSKVTSERAEKILESYREGQSIKQLAIRFGLKAKLISVLIANSEMDKKNIITNQKNLLTDWQSRKKEFDQKFEKLEVTPLFKIKNDNSAGLWECSKGHVFMDSLQAALRCSRDKRKLCPYCLGKVNYVRNMTSVKRQINIRLDDNIQNQLMELREYWKKKENFEFLNKNINGIGNSIFMSETNFAKFLLETVIENLKVDLDNEKQIDQISEWICEKRIEIPEIKNCWEELKNIKYETWLSNHPNKLEKYITQINKYSKNVIYETATEKWDELTEEIFEIIWPISLERSHKMHNDKNKELNDLKVERLKQLYGTKKD